MWTDGLIKDTRKKRGRRKTQRRKTATFTIQARAREKQAERKRMWVAGVLLVVIVVGFGWLLQRGLTAAGRYFFTENDRYQVQVWDLRSNGPLLTQAHIREYAQLTDNENLFALNIRVIRDRLESVPVIRSVEVRRQLPQTLVVRVDERLAIAQIGSRERFALATDKEGVVLGPGSVRPNLPVIVGLRQPGVRPGMRVTDPSFLDALRVLDLCARPQVQSHIRIRSINVQDAENLDIRLEGGEQVRIARAHLESRLAELVGIMQDQQGRGRTAAVINMTGEARIPPVVQYR